MTDCCEKPKNPKPLRILHAPNVALYQPLLQVRGLRELGHKVDYMVFDGAKDAHTLQGAPDFDLDIGRKKGKFPRIGSFFLKSLFKYDIIHLHSGWGLIPPIDISRGIGKAIYLLGRAFGITSPVRKFATPGKPVGMQLADIRLLRLLGKKIVFEWWGCDIRPKDAFKDRINAACDVCGEKARAACDNDYKRVLSDFCLKYGHANLSSGDICSIYPDYEWLSNVVDISVWRPMEPSDIPEKYRLPDNGKIRIYHSFSNSKTRGDIKGTTFIKQAVERLQSEGHNVEFVFCDGVPNLDVRYFQAQADIAVEQIRFGAYGSTLIECMAMGLPTLSYLREDVKERAPKGIPLVNATPETVYDELKKLVLDEDLRKKIGRESREFAEKNFSHIEIARKLEKIYRSL